MLVLSRLPGESITLRLEDGKEIVVSVVEVKGSRRVRLGFEADKSVGIVRDNAKLRDRRTTL